MSTSSAIDHHLRELEIARNPESAFHSMPELSLNDYAVLDIGCGIGQTFAASSSEASRLRVGLDVDLASLTYGHRHFSRVDFVNGTAEVLPFHDSSFDLIICRITLPYTNIPSVLAGIKRLLKKDGRVWFVLHPFSLTMRTLINAATHLRIKSFIYQSYVLTNGLYFHFSGKLFSFPFRGYYESFQTITRMVKVMKDAGFSNVCVQNGRQFIVTAQNSH